MSGDGNGDERILRDKPGAAPGCPRRWTIADPRRGIALSVEQPGPSTKRSWLVLSMFVIPNTGKLGKPFMIEYGLN